MCSVQPKSRKPKQPASGPKLCQANTHSDLKQTVPDVTILRHVCCGGVVLFGTNQPVHWIAHRMPLILFQ